MTAAREPAVKAPESAVARPLLSAPTGVLQRKCACGGSAGLLDECEDCRKEQLAVKYVPVQMKMETSALEPLIAPSIPVLEPEATAAGLLVEDSTTELEPGQMRKSDFLGGLEAEICAATEQALAGTGRTTKGCPYLEVWLAYYSAQPAGDIERSIRSYTPESAGAASAADYIPIITARVRAAVEMWVLTGEIMGVPEGLSQFLSPSGMPPDSTESIVDTLPGPEEGAFARSRRRKLSLVLRKARENRSATSEPAAVSRRLGNGSPLPIDTRARMESVFGHDFSRVRIHHDTPAAEMAASVHARAFTLGADIAFGSGEYRPGTLVGDALLAHELAHVAQQSGGALTAEALDSGRYNALEQDADRSAVSAVIALWKQTSADLAENALPRLRSGLRLQRCPCDESENVVPSTPLTLDIPQVECNPSPDTLENLVKLAGRSDALGVTKRADVKFGVSAKGDIGGRRCTYTSSEKPVFSFEKFMYTQAGTYDDGEESVTAGTCKGKKIPKKLHITTAMADKIKEGEVEHCNDHKRAFALSWGKYLQVMNEVETGGLCGHDSGCMGALETYFKARTGFEWKDRQPIGRCLANKTGLRDTRNWHSVITVQGRGTYAKDCSTVTYTHDPASMKEIGKTTSEDLVKGCGE